ncbi:MAG: DeoR family transcriptional regulator [Chloroflexi bacterium]|nr:DeoR family transcriptional regulator [Chloroflexota bacterium]
MMPTKDRLEQIVSLVNEHGFLSVGELSVLCQVSEMTIRRDLGALDKQSLVKRTYGGAASLVSAPNRGPDTAKPIPTGRPGGSPLDRVDVLIASSVNPKYDDRLLESIGKRSIPIIAESLAIQDEETVVAVDSYQAGRDMGRWAGQYALQHWGGRVSALDLTYSLSNTQARSRGFVAGLREVAPEAEVALSINAHSRYETAYQLTRDALAVHKGINIIFAINDTTAWGAINACRDMRLDPQSLIVMPFGLEGDRLKNALMEGEYCQAGLAMFPEIVGPVCVEAAIAAYNRQPLPHQLVTPYVIVTAETLPKIYARQGSTWKLRWEDARAQLSIPMSIDVQHPRPAGELPPRMGFIIPFIEHEWYRNLIACMEDYASQLKIDFEVIDSEQNLKDELDVRRRSIVRRAAEMVSPGDVILMDGGPIMNYLAEELTEKKDITVITNAMSVFNILKRNPDITLISTGGAFRHSSQMLVGPTAENALRELRGDKLFMTVMGISLNFGLSHTNISEVTMKQAMIRAAREVILLADHSYFGQESTVQVAPLTVVHRLITDDGLPASIRLDLNKLGLQIILAND